MRRVVVSSVAAIVASAFVCTMSWASGFDFDHRGNAAALTLWFCFIAGFLSFMLVFGYWRDEE